MLICWVCILGWASSVQSRTNISSFFWYRIDLIELASFVLILYQSPQFYQNWFQTHGYHHFLDNLVSMQIPEPLGSLSHRTTGPLLWHVCYFLLLLSKRHGGLRSLVFLGRIIKNYVLNINNLLLFINFLNQFRFSLRVLNRHWLRFEEQCFLLDIPTLVYLIIFFIFAWIFSGFAIEILLVTSHFNNNGVLLFGATFRINAL